MAEAKIHSIKEKSALLLVRKSKFEFSSRPAYVPIAAVEGFEEGETIEIPDGFDFVEMVDGKTGEVYTTKDGQPLHCLKW